MMTDSRTPIADYLAKTAEFDALGTDDHARIAALQDEYFPGVIDRNYPHTIRLDPSRIDSRAKLWFYIDYSIRIDGYRHSIIEDEAKRRECPGPTTSTAEDFKALSLARSREEIRVAANACLQEIYRALTWIGLGLIVPRPPWPSLTRLEALTEIRRVGGLLVDLERENALAAQPQEAGDPEPPIQSPPSPPADPASNPEASDETGEGPIRSSQTVFAQAYPYANRGGVMELAKQQGVFLSCKEGAKKFTYEYVLKNPWDHKRVKAEVERIQEEQRERRKKRGKA